MTADRQTIRARRGFTLVEMLVVMAIMILLFVFLIGGLGEVAASRRLYNAVERVANTAALARSKAISENAIFHVRVLNRGPNDQWIGVYRFKKAANGLKSADEPAAQLLNATDDTWDDPALVEPFDLKKLDPGTYFETQYDPAKLFLSGTDRVKTIDAVHGDLGEFYYDPSGNLPYPARGDKLNLLPKQLPVSMSAGPWPSTHQLLFFYPDGTASGNFLIVLRDKQHIGYVRIWPGGLIRNGTIGKRKEYEDLK